MENAGDDDIGFAGDCAVSREALLPTRGEVLETLETAFDALDLRFRFAAFDCLGFRTGFALGVGPDGDEERLFCEDWGDSED
jgi:hypothetical protein